MTPVVPCDGKEYPSPCGTISPKGPVHDCKRKRNSRQA